MALWSTRRRCLGLLLLAWRLPVLAQPQVLRVVGSADPPYRVFGPEGAGGLYFELLNEAARRLDLTLRYQEVPSARALRMMEAGEADLMMGLLRTPEREAFLSYGQIRLPAEDKALYTRPQVTPVRQLGDLLGRRVVVQRGKLYGAALSSLPRQALTEVNDYRSALEMVARGRVDVAIVPERQGDLLLKATPMDLVKQPWRLPGEVPYVVLSRRSPWLARQADLERAFQSMHEDGSWRAIVARYR
ncbi:substrate-binding periplasmic protein [Roseateles sp. BYS78W]|uniref:Substrate-binding periplasmic protein n=1 Tax=Pelomonas candidula TaxID=3299025 RepID=A0ABW7H5J7_9BURK